MTLPQAILLGLIQGVTEFLPISSSAHLILVPYVLGWQGHGLRFDVVTNAGTLLAAVVYFRHDLVDAGRRMFDRRGAGRSAQRRGLAPAVMVGSVPIVVVGVLFYDWFATAARQPVVIALASIGFGIVLWWADRTATQVRGLDQTTWRDGLWIGAAQALALIPGTSRSGITMTAGLALGFDRRAAARFSFLLAIPVGTLALAKDVLDLARGELPAAELAPLAVGFVTAAASAYLVIGWLLAWLRRQGMTPFVVYRVLLGVAILGLLYAR
jgi:undecaprenyl-diphosphatase